MDGYYTYFGSANVHQQACIEPTGNSLKWFYYLDSPNLDGDECITPTDYTLWEELCQ